MTQAPAERLEALADSDEMIDLVASLVAVVQREMSAPESEWRNHAEDDRLRTNVAHALAAVLTRTSSGCTGKA